MGNECEDNPTFMMTHCKAQCDEWKSSTYGLEAEDIEDFYDLEAKDIDGNIIEFEEFQDHVLLITNVASYCSKTEQHYKELVKLHTDISKLQLTYTKFDIFAFPSNQFLNQEPESSPQKLKEYIQQKYNVQFTIMSKIDLNGSTSSIVYKYLKSINGPFKIKDCFYTYFIVDGWARYMNILVYIPRNCMRKLLCLLRIMNGLESWKKKNFDDDHYKMI